VPVLVDGNNLLHAARGAEQTGPLVGRSLLCDALAKWARRRRERVHVVFDGRAPRPDLAKQIGTSDIRVSYSGRRSADAVLIETLETDSAARRILVVSSDHEIIRAARRRRAKAMRSGEFWTMVQRDLSRPKAKPAEPPEKRRGLTPPAAEQWLKEFGLGQEDRGEADDG